MKFRFCGEADCPDWLLMQINSLSNLSPPKLQELCEIVVQPLIGKEMDYIQLKNFAKAASLELSEVKACVSAVQQILKSGSCYAVSPSDLGQELEQLGLDRQHSQAIVEVYSKERNEIMNRLKDCMIRTGRLNDVKGSKEGANGIILHLSHTNYCDVKREDNVFMTREQAEVFLAELKSLKKRMEELEAE